MMITSETPAKMRKQPPRLRWRRLVAGAMIRA